MNNLYQTQAQDAIISLFSPLVDVIVNKVTENVLFATEKKEPKYYTRKEVCDMLRITLPTLAKLSNNGVLPCKRIGNRVLYDANEIDAAVKEKVVFKYKRVK